MELTTILILASGLAMDACAVSLCNGLNHNRFRHSLQWMSVILFALFQGLMLFLGAVITSAFSEKMMAFNHWIAMALLVMIGLNMIMESRHCDAMECTDHLTFKTILIQAVATSLDAFAAGAGLSLVTTDIFTPVFWTALVTGLYSAIALKAGKYCGKKMTQHAQLLGGLICIVIGIKIVIEHYF